MFHGIKDWFARSTSERHDGVLSRVALERAILCEKARTDRTHIPFSLICLSAAFRTARGQKLFEQIREFSAGRLRITDSIGWVDRQTVGVLLPITGAEGALTVAQEYLERFSHHLHLQVHTYPTQWILDGSDEPHDDDRHQPVGPQDPGDGRIFERRMPAWKRSIDVMASATGLLMLSPLLLLIASLIKSTSPGPVLYQQQRAGRGGRPFRIYKFRTMVANADHLKHQLAAMNEQDGPAFKIKNDPRITSLGRFLRKTSLDELPQLWNILRGDMSLVGPRPLPCDESAACAPWQKRRLEITPGLTCIWQVYGRSSVTFDEWMRMDQRYLRTSSMLFDIKLIWMTLWMTLVKKNGM